MGIRKIKEGEKELRNTSGVAYVATESEGFQFCVYPHFKIAKEGAMLTGSLRKSTNSK